jgi:transposase
MTVPTDSLPDDPGTLKAMLLAERARAERLEQIIKELQRHRFGRRAETLPEDQLLLGLEDVEQFAAGEEGEQEAKTPAERKARASQRRANRGSLPGHLPRVEMTIDVDDRTCPCCRGVLHVIGEDRAERLDIVPAQFRVLVVRRPKYGCRACEDVVVQAPAPSRLIEGGIPTEATVAQVLVSKYADHLPLYRQAPIYARQGINLDRSTLSDWVGRAAFLLRPVHERLLAVLKSSTKLFADETTAPVLDPGRGRTKTGQLFAYARDDRPWGGTDPPAVAYIYAPDRKAARPIAHLADFVVCCRLTDTPVIAPWRRKTPSRSRSVGRMCGAASLSSHPRALHRSPVKHSNASPPSTTSRATSAVATLTYVGRFDRKRAGRSFKPSSPGCAPSSP